MATDEELSNLGRKLAKSRWDRATQAERDAHGRMMRAARQSDKERFYDMVDPERELSQDVRDELAGQARSLYYARINAKRRATLARKKTLGSGDPKVQDSGNEGVA